MIANTLIFLLGMLVTALAALVLAPIVWRKAQSLARHEFEATIPISANEIRAEFDRVRAEAAVSVRRQEVLSAEAREKAAKAEADRGRFVVEISQLTRDNRRLVETVEDLDRALDAARTTLAEREAENRDLGADIAAIRDVADRRGEEIETLGRRFQDLGDLAEERTIELLAAKERIGRLEERLEPASETGPEARLDAMAAEIAELQQALRRERAGTAQREDKIAALASQLTRSEAKVAALSPVGRKTPAEPVGESGKRGDARDASEPPRSGSPRFEAALGRRAAAALDPAEGAEIRERISDIAARVIRMTALVEGPNSPLAALLQDAGPDDPAGAPAAKPTLADRVRLLAEAEGRKGS